MKFMSVRSQVIISILIVIGMASVIQMVRKRRIDLRYALVWVLVSLGVLVFTLFPNFLTWLSGFLGIASPVNMLFFIGFCFSLIIIYTLSIATSRLSAKVKVMAQEMAILKYDLYRKEEKMENREF